MNRGTAWLLYDGDCRLCTAAAWCVRSLDLGGRLRVRAIQESDDLLRSVPPEDRARAVRAIGPDGRMVAGPDALPLILATLAGAPGMERVLRSSSTAMSSLSRLYRLLVGLRGRLSCGVSAPS